MAKISQNSWLAVGVATVIFGLGSSLLIHDSTVLVQSSLSQEEIQEVAASRPVLFDILGQRIKVSEKDYENVLRRGGYRAAQNATIAMISPKNQVAMVDLRQAPQALISGWAVEPLDHALARVLEFKQQSSMWIDDSPDLWFQYAVFFMGAILFFGTFVTLRLQQQSVEN